MYISGISQLFLTRFGLNFQGKVKARSRQGQGKVKARLRQCQGKVERQGQGKINVRLRQNNNNQNHNYNLMGFDTVEINVGFLIKRGKLCLLNFFIFILKFLL